VAAEREAKAAAEPEARNATTHTTGTAPSEPSASPAPASD
jgi:hypothetical protein